MRRSRKILRAGRVQRASYLNMFGLPTNQIVHLSGLIDKTIREIKSEPGQFARDDPKFRNLFPCAPKAREESTKRNFRYPIVRKQAAFTILLHYKRYPNDIWNPEPTKVIESLMVAGLEWQRIYTTRPETTEKFHISPSFALTLMKELEYGKTELIKCGKCDMPVLLSQYIDKPKSLRCCGFCNEEPEPFREIILSRHR